MKKWTTWFKERRAILESDVIHGRRPDGRDVDWLLHVNPALPTKALLVAHNPLAQPVRRTLDVDFTYAGLSGRTTMRVDDRDVALVLDARHRAKVELSFPARGFVSAEFR